MDDRELGLQLGRAVKSGFDVSALVFVQLAQTEQLDDVTVTEHAELFAQWQPDISYAAGQIVRYDDMLYRCVQAHTSQSGWTPTAAPALWTRIGDPGDEWPEWSQPIGAHDAYGEGDKVSYGGKRWVSAVSGNVWQPGVYGWTEVVA